MIAATPPGERTAIIGQLVRFGLVGGLVTALAIIVYWVPATFMGVPPLVANTLGYLAAVATGYVLHSRVSFRGHGSRDRPARRTGRFVAVSIISYLMNSGFVWLFTDALDGETWWPIPAMLFVTPLVTFTLNRKWVFA